MVDIEGKLVNLLGIDFKGVIIYDLVVNLIF